MAEVLVVDDSPDMRALLELTLKTSGHQVRMACDGTEGLAALEARPPDCMVLDVMMPGMDGFGVLAARRQRHIAPETRVIILTCRTEERDFARGWELGADEYLTKPFDPELLVERVRQLLTTSREDLEAKRTEELRKAELLDRLEVALAQRAADAE